MPDQPTTDDFDYDSFSRDPSQPEPPAPDPRRRWVVVATILLVAIPLLHAAAKREVARWYHAAAMDAIYSEDPQSALQHVQTGLSWSPNDLNLLLRSANFHMKMTSASAAAEVSDQALAIAQSNFDSFPSEDVMKVLVGALNTSAYSHALDESELEQALENIEKAISFFEQAGFRPDAGLIDTRGYLHHLLGNHEQALEDTETAVAQYSRELPGRKADRRQNSKLLVDKQQLTYQAKLDDESMAVLTQHRGLAYQAAGRLEEAEKDFARAKKLGFDPQNGVW